MLRITLILISALLFTVAQVSATTIHILWITAKNETGYPDLRLAEAQPPRLNHDGEDWDRMVNWLPISGVSIREYTFGKDSRDDCALEKNAIRRFIRNLNVGSDDAVVIYYRGHGVFDEKAKGIRQYEAQHSYQFASDDCRTPSEASTYDFLLHRDLRLDVEAKNPRLAVFIRDCCGAWGWVPTRGVRAPRDRMAMAPAEEPRLRNARQELFISLFVQSRGIVDIAATQVGFAALSQPVPDYRNFETSGDYYYEPTEKYYEYGTVFSNSFAEVFDSNRGRGLTWDAFFGALKPNCERRFARIAPRSGLSSEDMKLVGKHTPRAAPLGGIYAMRDFDNRLAKSTIPENYFEIEGEPVYGGVLLTRIASEGRGASYGLEHGDIIYAVDDVLVTTNKELELAIRILGDDGKLKLTLVNCRDGSIQDFEYPDIRADIQ